MRVRTGSATRGLFGAARLIGVVALLIAFVGLPLSASADVGITRFVFYLVAGANRSLTDLCVGDVVKIDVKAERFLANRRDPLENRTTNPPVQFPGVTITGTVGNPEVGGLFFTRQITSLRSSPPGSAQFKFTATKAGTTGIIFTGTLYESNAFRRFVNGDQTFLPTELDVTVKNCEYAIYATTHWHAFNLDYSALVSDIRLASTGGSRYTGSGNWTFVVTDNPVRDPCGPHTKTYEARVDVTGEVDGDELIVDIDYARPTGEWRIYDTFDCTPSARETLTQFPEALTFTVPASGGSLSLFQTLRDITGLAVYEVPNGGARVTVRPVVAE